MSDQNQPKQPPEVLAQGFWQAWREHERRSSRQGHLLLQRGRQLLERFQHFYDALSRLSRPAQRRWQKRLATSLAGVALTLALSNAPVAFADSTITVGGSCTLIDAITAANADAAVGGCVAGSGADTIVLAGGTYSLTSVDNTAGQGANGLPVITSPITIEGNGSTIARDPNAPNFRILQVNGNLTLNNTTITGGVSTNFSTGGIFNYGTLTVNNSTVSGNSYSGIVNVGNTTLTNSTVSNSDNGIYNSGSLILTNSTVSGNGNRGGIVNDGSYSTASATLTNSTISGNSGNGITSQAGYLGSSSVTLVRSLISGNAEKEVSAQYGGTVSGGNFNLIGHDGSANSSGFTPSGSDIVPSQTLAAILGPLANNGGPTLTHALVTGSPAINAAPSGPATDQRGVTRPQGPAFDVGAFELEQAANQAPTVAANNASVTVDEGQTASNTGTVSDADNDPVTLSASLGTVIDNNDGTWSWSVATSDGPASETVTITADDGNGGTSSTTFDLTVNNVAPTVDAISAPVDPQPVNTTVNASASFSDPGTGDTHTAAWDWVDGNTSAGTVTESSGAGSVSDSHTYITPGVYTIQLTVTDDDGGVGESIYQYVVVYDPAGGFVTGGDWITSPAGAYTPDPSLTGKANFGFNSKYKQGQSTPSGNTEFQFKVADLNFKSSSYEWLVVAGSHAKFKGVGTINGSGNYDFMLTATDGQINGGGGADLFRIKIWDKDNGDAVVYDNQMGQGDDSNAGTALGGGSIVIHRGGASGASADDTSAQPNQVFLPLVTQ